MTNAGPPVAGGSGHSVKTELYLKVFQIGLLGVLTLGASIVAQFYAQRRAEAELVRGFIGDLTSTDQLRRDIAIKALQHASSGRRHRDLVDQVLAVIVRSQGTAPTGSAALISVEQRQDALSALRSRAPALHDSVATVLSEELTQSLVTRGVREQVVSSADTNQSRPMPATAPVRRAIDLARVLGQSTIYIQYRDGASARRVELLRSALREHRHIVPPAELIATRFESAVRYFHATDSALAAEIAVDLQGALGVAPAEAPPVRLVTLRGRTAPPKQVELWLDFNNLRGTARALPR